MPFPSPGLYPGPTVFPGTTANPAPSGAPPPPQGTWFGDSGDQYTRAIRSGAALWYTVDAYLDEIQITSNLRPSGGTITDTSKPGGRRLLNLELPPEPGLFDLLAPSGTELRVTAHLRYADRTVIDIPMGWYGIDSESLSEGGGGLSLTAPDRWAKISRARFITPRSVPKGRLVVDEITSMIRGALGGTTEVLNYSLSSAKCAAQTFDRDRDAAIIELATSAGLWVYFDRDGVATIVRQPTGGGTAKWRADASQTGVLLTLDRERSRVSTRNVVVLESSAPDTPAFPVQIVWDANPASPTYAGSNPKTSPGSAGPFGVVPYFHDTPLPLTVSQARETALTILARVIGLAAQVSLSQGHNPAIDAFDTLEVLPPRERADMPRVLERHLVDTVTHPLTVESPQQIEGRSTRTDPYVSEG